MLPEAGLIKTEMLGRVCFFAKLPLPHDAGGIACLFEQMGKGGLFAVQYSKAYIVSKIGHARHDLNPRGRA